MFFHDFFCLIMFLLKSEKELFSYRSQNLILTILLSLQYIFTQVAISLAAVYECALDLQVTYYKMQGSQRVQTAATGTHKCIYTLNTDDGEVKGTPFPQDFLDKISKLGQSAAAARK